MTEYKSMREIGALYGVTSHTLGRWLRDLGLRTANGKPSTTAFSEGYVAQRPSRQPGTYYYAWNVDQTVNLLDRMGYERT